jgi:hypothetical protein
MDPWYCTREQVAGALDTSTTALDDQQIDRAIASAARNIEGRLHRVLYPHLATRTFDWPADSRSWRLWLEQHSLISVTTLTAGGVAIAAADYLLRPMYGPPYEWIEIDLGSSAAFAAGATSQDAISIVGKWGYRDDEDQVGDLASSLAATTTATATITWNTPRIGVGDVLRINSERMIVTAKTWVDSTQNLATPLTASKSNVTVAVSDGTAFAADDVLLLDSERMLVTDVAGNNLTVRRAYDGSVLAAHSGSDVYTRRGIELARAQLGTTIAAHSSSDDVLRWVPPSLINSLNIAEAIDQIHQEQAGYARTSGSGDTQRELAAIGLKRLRDDATTLYGRKLRTLAV